MTASQPIYCQGGRKSASLVHLSPDALTSQIGWQLLPCNPSFGIATVLISIATVASLHPTGATLAEGWSGTLSCNPTQTTKWMQVTFKGKSYNCSKHTAVNCVSPPYPKGQDLSDFFAWFFSKTERWVKYKLCKWKLTKLLWLEVFQYSCWKLKSVLWNCWMWNFQ